MKRPAYVVSTILCDGDSTASYQQQHINNVMVIIDYIFALYTD